MTLKNKPSPKRKVTTFAITKKADELLNLLAARDGLSRTSVFEMLIREKARQVGLE